MFTSTKPQNKRKTFNIDTQSREGKAILSISGRLTLDNFYEAVEEIRSLLQETDPSEIVADGSDIEYMDSSGALTFLEIENWAKRKSVPFEFMNLANEFTGILSLVDAASLHRLPIKQEGTSAGIIERAGERVLAFVDEVAMLGQFFRKIILAILNSIYHPLEIRWRDVLFEMRKAGLGGLPIVALLNFLLGLIVALMATTPVAGMQLRSYIGAAVAMAIIKEFGPIFTAIIVAGRSGSAFAGEIGTMKSNEEVDALVTMGFNPVRFLVIPKLFAIVIILPLLTIYADFFGVMGGMVIGWANLGIHPNQYFEQIPVFVSLSDVIVSLAKTVVFALIISTIGCHMGFRTRGGAESLGTTVTSTLVRIIFLIIAFDSFYAMVIHYV